MGMVRRFVAPVLVGLLAFVALRARRAPGIGHGSCENQEVPDTMETLDEYPPFCGLRELPSGYKDRVRVFAYTQNGGWCWSNSGVIYDVETREVTLVDVLTDTKQTRLLLDAVRGALPAEAQITTLVFTHCDIDHIGGMQLVFDEVKTVYAGAGCEAAMKGYFKSDLGKKIKIAHYAWFLLEPAVTWLLKAKVFGEGVVPDWVAALAMAPVLDPFSWDKTVDLHWVAYTRARKLVTHTIDNKMVSLGDHVTLIPANLSSHSDHDVVVDVLGEVRFTGDILFNGITPIAWSGSLDDCIEVCHSFEQWEGLLVPGHGAIQHSSQKPFKKMIGYWETLKEMKDVDPMRAMETLPSEYLAWADAKRTAINLAVQRHLLENPQGKVDKIGFIKDYVKLGLKSL